MAASFLPFCVTDKLTHSNCYILEDTGKALIIDPNDFTAIQSYLTKKALIPELIILTHEHGDHISALNELRDYYPVTVLSSYACSLGIQNTTLNMTRIMESYLYFKSGGKLHVAYPRFVCSPADITFAKSYDCFWHQHQLRCIAIPGHTLGSSCIIIDNTLLFSGDYFIPGEVVITRLPGSDETAYNDVGKPRLRLLPEHIRTYPGHGKSFILTREMKQCYGL